MAAFARAICIAIFCIIAFTAWISHAAAEEYQPSVLLLNSYHRGLAWTDDQTDGFISGLRKAKLDSTVYTEYLDWKNNSTNENLQVLANLYRIKYAQKKIDLVMATDDAALDFAIRNRNDLFPNAPIVFSGVHPDAAKQMLWDKTNVTGVYEEIDAEGTIRLVTELNPNLQEIYLIYDNSESGLNTRDQVERAAAKIRPDIKITHFNSVSYYAIMSFLEQAPDNSAVFVTSYCRDINGVVMEPERFIKLFSQVSRVPVYIFYDFLMGYGAVGGSVLSGRLQGELAAQSAVRILRGEKAFEVPFVRNNTSVTMLDYRLIEHFNLPVGRIPAETVFINRPLSFYEQNQHLIWAVVIAFVFFTVYIAFLRENINRRKAAEERLQKNNEELTALNEEMLAAQEELHAQYQQLAAAQDALNHAAFHDPLTGLFNRAALNQRLSGLFAEKQVAGAVMLLDLDNFKVVNDTFGHSCGDSLLHSLGALFKDLICEKQFVARMGGDEFVLLLEGAEAREGVIPYAERILQTFNKPFFMHDKSFHITASMGITLFPADGGNFEELMRNADLALYQAKGQGKNRYVFFEKSMQETVRQKVEVERELRNALNEEEFELWYQPLVDVITEKVVGFEALIRWFSREKGLVMPMSFIELAEETGLIIPIGYWAIQQACDFISRLHREGYQDLRVTVNISVVQIMQSDFVGKVKQMIADAQIPPGSFGIEITESMLMESFDSNIQKLNELRQAGVAIYLDDFGTGYSSLKYIKHLPIDIVKIDKSFTDDLAGRRERELVGSIINLTHQLGLKVVAEGVETELQMEKLRIYQCDIVQGYFFSKSMPEEAAWEFLKKP